MAPGLENFSLLGGPLYMIGARLDLVRGGRTVALGFALGWGSWLVLVTLAFAQGRLQDLFTLAAIAVHARLLLAIPLFFVAETNLDAKLREFVALLVRSGAAGEKAAPELEAEAARLSRWEASWAPDAVSLLAAAALTYFGPRTGSPVAAETGFAVAAAPWASLWYWLWCLPLFRFLMIRWAWRLLLWWRLLWRLTRMDIILSPAHPDGAGGLGYLEVVHKRFAPLALAISIIVSAKLAEDIARGQSTLSEAYPELIATLLMDCVLFLGPPCLFFFKLRACMEQGLRDYTALASRYVHAFERKWIAGTPAEERLLGTPDLQSLADLANSMEVVRKMRLAPISMRLLATIGIAAVLPMLPLFLFEFPLTDLVKLLFSKLAGI